jgi:hypothetical protein
LFMTVSYGESFLPPQTDQLTLVRHVYDAQICDR